MYKSSEESTDFRHENCSLPVTNCLFCNRTSAALPHIPLPPQILVAPPLGQQQPPCWLTYQQAARKPPQGSATRTKFQSLSAVSNKLISDTCNSYDHPPVVLINRARGALTCNPSSKPCPTEKNFRACKQSIQIHWFQVLHSSACGAHSGAVTSCLGRRSVKMKAVTSFAHQYSVPVFEHLRTLYFTKN